MSGFEPDFGDIYGMAQRRQQLAEQSEIKNLLQQKQREQQRINRLLKCPACKIAA